MSASLEQLSALADELGLPGLMAVAWHERGLSLDHAKADAAHRIRLRRVLGEQRMAEAALRG